MTLKDLPKYWRSKYFESWQPEQVYRGIYLTNVSFDNDISDLIKDKYPDLDFIDPWLSSYGVCDHWTQILAKYRKLDEVKESYLIHHTPIYKSDQSEDGGWRWHKWGPYIGEFQEQAQSYEYLYDTPDVEMVYVYNIVELNY